MSQFKEMGKKLPTNSDKKLLLDMLTKAILFEVKNIIISIDSEYTENDLNNEVNCLHNIFTKTKEMINTFEVEDEL